jgi:hypothetical protein
MSLNKGGGIPLGRMALGFVILAIVLVLWAACLSGTGAC